MNCRLDFSIKNKCINRRGEQNGNSGGTAEVLGKRNRLDKPELLAPAGNLEKLKFAIHYGADAVYIGGQAYGLRSNADNFSFEEMREGVEFAKSMEPKCS